MLLLQVSIGALNDAMDAPLDAAGKPGKPIPSGLATRATAARLTAIGGLGGLALSAPSGPATVVVAGLGLGLGYLYDVRLSRGTWSWLPLAAALPLVPIHAWLGATGSVPPGLLVLVPVAVGAGAALALANGLVDLERDARAGRVGIVVRLGRSSAWRLHAVLLAVVAAAAIVVAPAPGAAAGQAGLGEGVIPTEALVLLRSSGVWFGIGALLLGGMALTNVRAAIRERGWELEAAGILAIGVGWLAGAAAVARQA